MAIGKGFSRSFIRPGIFGATVAFLVLVTWIPAQAQKGESSQAVRRTAATRPAPAAPAHPVVLRVRDIPALDRLTFTAATSLPLPSDGKTIPTHVYAPYYTSTGSGDATLTASGARYFTMAFLQAATANAGSCTVYWNGSSSTPVAATGTYATGIANLRSYGGDVIPSFGGSAADTYPFEELADSCQTVSSIAAEYERVITTLNVTRIDLDTEEDSLNNTAGIDRRNKAIAMVQQWAAQNGRSVEWVYTLPTNVAGLDAGVWGSNYTTGAGVLLNAVENGTRIDRVDIMTFDFYDAQSYACQAGQGPAHEMGQDTMTAVGHVYDTLHELYPNKTSAQIWGMIGFCEDVGKDDFGACETYYTYDATNNMAWGVSNGLGLMTFWNYSRDKANTGGSGTPIYSFSHIYDNYSSLGPGTGTGPTLTGWGASSGLESSTNPSTSGEPVSFTASTTALDPGLPTPTGTVQFVVDGSNSGSPVTVDGNGNATSAPISNLSIGTHSITAIYSGDGVFTTVTTAPLTQAVGVSIPVLAVPNILITSNQNPSPFDSQPTFTATLTSGAGEAKPHTHASIAAPTPTGTVQFLLDDVDLNGPVALVNGQASSSPINDYPHPWPASGPHRVSVIYSGDSNFQPTVSSIYTQTVDNCGNCATSITIASSANPSYTGQSVAFTWNLSTAVGNPTGSVQVVADGTNVLGTWPLAFFNGTVQVTSSTLSQGSHSVVAVYSGDADFAGSTSSPALTQVVNPPVTVTVTTLPTGRSFSVDGGRAATKATNYTWAQGTNHTLAITSTTQAGTAGTQYVWSNWSDGGAATHTVTAPITTTTYTANFNTQYQLTSAVSPAGAGTVSPTTGGYDNASTPVALTATPASGYVFSKWTTTASGTLTNPTNPTTATV
ncbi:MAG: Ig-like domain repeat protein, partial [Terriglobia bacterium]